jgi:DNA gyrase subunit A
MNEKQLTEYQKKIMQGTKGTIGLVIMTGVGSHIVGNSPVSGPVNSALNLAAIGNMAAIGMSIIPSSEEVKKGYLLVISEYGYGKRTGLSKYKAQKRGGVGVKTMNIKSKTGELVVSMILTKKESDLIVMSQQGQVIRMEAQSISELGRDTQGVRIMKLNNKDKIVSIASL